MSAKAQGAPSGAFEALVTRAARHDAREAGLPGRMDCEATICPRCGQQHAFSGLCTECLEKQARAEEHQDSLVHTLKRAGVRYVEDLPRETLRAHQRIWRA